MRWPICTRCSRGAEEGGLFGARLMAEAGALPKETLIVSVESSPVIPGVAQGEGPVIRTGDAAYTFDADAEQVLIAARESIKGKRSRLQIAAPVDEWRDVRGHAFAVFGYRATGIAFPLGNYHNATTRIADQTAASERNTSSCRTFCRR